MLLHCTHAAERCGLTKALIVGKYLHEKWRGHRVLYNEPSSSIGTVAQPGEKEMNDKMPQSSPMVCAPSSPKFWAA